MIQENNSICECKGAEEIRYSELGWYKVLLFSIAHFRSGWLCVFFGFALSHPSAARNSCSQTNQNRDTVHTANQVNQNEDAVNTTNQSKDKVRTAKQGKDNVHKPIRAKKMFTQPEIEPIVI